MVVIVLTLLRSNPDSTNQAFARPRQACQQRVDDAIETARALPWSVAPWPTHLAGRIITGTGVPRPLEIGGRYFGGYRANEPARIV